MLTAMTIPVPETSAILLTHAPLNSQRIQKRTKTSWHSESSLLRLFDLATTRFIPDSSDVQIRHHHELAIPRLFLGRSHDDVASEDQTPRKRSFWAVCTS